MKPKVLPLAYLLAGCLLGKPAGIAAVFQNLNFDSPSLPLVPNDPQGHNRVPISDAMPGWTGYIGNGPQSLVLHNANFLGSAGISLVGPGEWSGVFVPRNVVEGNYTAFLQTGVGIFGGSPETVSTSLAQLGLVPLTAQSLRLSIDAVGPFSVTLGGQPLSLIPLQTFPNYTIYGADVSGFIGQTEELRITCEAWFGPNPGGGFFYSHLWVDSINFSPMPVPEPGPVALVAVGLTALGLARAFRRLRR